MMKRFEHDNIVRLLGVCTRGEPAYAVMEFMLYGKLAVYFFIRTFLSVSFHMKVFIQKFPPESLCTEVFILKFPFISFYMDVSLI